MALTTASIPGQQSQQRKAKRRHATITGAVNAGGLVRVTATAHGFSANDWVVVTGVVGTTEANGTWRLAAVTANTADLAGTTFTNAYVSGGDMSRGA